MSRAQTTDRPIISVDFSDGHEVFQTYYHSDFTENQRAAILHICANAGRDPVPPVQAKPILLASEEPTLGKPAANRQQRSKEARAQGYIGDPCTNCQGMRVKRNGSCLVCDDCGTTTGCS